MTCARCGNPAVAGAVHCLNCGAVLPGASQIPDLRKAPLGRRYLAALGAGLLVYLCTLYRFQTYAERNRAGPGVAVAFAGLMLMAGFAVTLGTPHRRYFIATVALAGAMIGHVFVIFLDCQIDPTNHNLFPFELVFLAILSAPVYAGASAAHLVDWLRQRRFRG